MLRSISRPQYGGGGLPTKLTPVHYNGTHRLLCPLCPLWITGDAPVRCVSQTELCTCGVATIMDSWDWE